MIASPSLRPKRCSIESIRSEPKIRIRSSSSETKNFEAPGRPWRLEVLRFARGCSDADLRLRADGLDAAALGPQGGRGDHPSLGQQGARQGTAEGRGAQLRYPQSAPQIRRRDERPAQSRL